MSWATNWTKAVRRPEVARSPNGHGILQGERAKAAAMWRKAIALADAKNTELYRRRLDTAEGPATVAALPR